MYKKGFTLIELLVVVSIIGVLSSIVLGSLSGARDKGKISATLVEIRDLERSLLLYIIDTNQNPSLCIVSCNENNDPLLNDLGVSGWSGPYSANGIYYRTHAWGGHFGINYQ